MAVDFIDNNAFVQSIIDKGKAEASKRNTNEMGKEDFLNLLVLQLRYQDPLSPVDDKEFIAQMAQFSALEQMQNMNASNTAMKGFSMIGKYVTAMLQNDATGINQVVEGHVESVIMNGSKTFVVVAGKEIPIDNVYNVADGYNPLNSTLSAYTGLIGYLVKGAVFDISTGEVVGVTGEVVSLAKGVYEDYAMLDGVDAVIAGVNRNGEIEEDRAKLKEYLDGVAANENAEDRHIEVFITDENGKRVPIGATLRSYVIDPVFGTVNAVLDDVAAPVASVASIKKAAQGANVSGAGGSGNSNGADGTDSTGGTNSAGGTGGAGSTSGTGGTGSADGTGGTGNADGTGETGNASETENTDGTKHTNGIGNAGDTENTDGTKQTDGTDGSSEPEGTDALYDADETDRAEDGDAPEDGEIASKAVA